MIQVPTIAEEMAKHFEGCERIVQRVPVVAIAPYLCPAAYWTIGWGHLCSKDQAPISQEQADAWLVQDMGSAADSAVRLSPVLVTAGSGKLSAIIDFIYNLGAGRYQASTLRRRVNALDWKGAANEARRWVYGGGKKLPGLVARREAEATLLEAA